MKLSSAITVKIAEIEALTPEIKRIALVHADGPRLPAWSSGSHIEVTIKGPGRVWRNAYSLIGAPGDTECYQIAVRRADPEFSKGGSLCLHETAAVGDVLTIGLPNNYFPLAHHARKHLLIAGGIGITPILSHLQAITVLGGHFELHYAIRSRCRGAFLETLLSDYGERANVYVSDEGVRLSPAAVLADQPLGTHVYVCGPHSLVSAVSAAAAELGWPYTHVHIEEFSPPPISNSTPFVVGIPALKVEVKVGLRQTILEALLEAGVPIRSSCRVGQCGTCEMQVLDGDPDHRDRCLSEGEMNDGRIIACVSRCRGDRLILALPDLIDATTQAWTQSNEAQQEAA